MVHIKTQVLIRAENTKHFYPLQANAPTMMMESPKATEDDKVKLFSPQSGYIRKSLKGLFPEAGGGSFRNNHNDDVLASPEKTKTVASPNKKKSRRSLRGVRRSSTSDSVSSIPMIADDGTRLPEKTKTVASPNEKKSRRSLRGVRRSSTSDSANSIPMIADDGTRLIKQINNSEDAFVYHHIKNMSVDAKAELLGRVMERITVDEQNEESEQKRSRKKKINSKKLGLLRKPTTTEGGSPEGDGANRTRQRSTKRRSRAQSTGALGQRIVS